MVKVLERTYLRSGAEQAELAELSCLCLRLRMELSVSDCCPTLNGAELQSFILWLWLQHTTPHRSRLKRPGNCCMPLRRSSPLIEILILLSLLITTSWSGRASFPLTIFKMICRQFVVFNLHQKFVQQDHMIQENISFTNYNTSHKINQLRFHLHC